MFRGTVGDTQARRWVSVERDGEAIGIVSAGATVRKPDGTTAVVAIQVDDAAAGLIRLQYPTLDQPGDWVAELAVNGEHLEEPVVMHVRPEYRRGPR